MAGTLHTLEDGLDVREANHRMKNILAMLLGMFRRDFAGFSDQTVRGAATKFETQVFAISALLQAVSSRPAAEDVAIHAYLEELGRALSGAVFGQTRARLELCVDPGRLPVDVAERLGLIVVELVFNAIKYAFPDEEDGVVRIDMVRRRRHWSCLVSDNGVGMDRSGRGAGLNIVRALARSLNGRLIIRSGARGACVGVVLPDHPALRGHGPIAVARAPRAPALAA